MGEGMRKLTVVMVTFLVVGVASAMTPQQAVNILRSVTEQVPLKAPDHRQVEAAYSALESVIKQDEDTTKLKKDLPKKSK